MRLCAPAPLLTRTHAQCAELESAPLAQTQQYINDRAQFERIAVERTRQHAQSDEAQGAEPPAEEKAPLPVPESAAAGPSAGASALVTGAEGTTLPEDDSTDETSSKRIRLT